MDAFVHFAVGLASGLLVLLFVDWPPRRQFLAMFASGVWAMVPDGHWMLRAAGFDVPADLWLSAHRSVIADLFWFHRLLDNAETGRSKVEMGLALFGLLAVVVVFYTVNDWNIE